MINQIAKHEEP